MTGPPRRVGSRASEGGSGDRVPHRRVARDPDGKARGMERLADLLPQTARKFGLEEQLEQAGAASAWLEVVAERVPAAIGLCRLVDLNIGVATIETDEPIVAQEIRLRSPELLAALRDTTRTPIRQLRVTTRHV
ncbi:MAG TPA: DciA family protein [Candidatus Limnocylindrales bacterium]|jgi:predicted nucleic acid-binding Zn ribbon protein